MFFFLDKKEPKNQDCKFFSRKTTPINLLRDPSRQGTIQDSGFNVSLVVALPSGSLERLTHMVYCLVLLRKEFKVAPNSNLRLLRGSVLFTIH